MSTKFTFADPVAMVKRKAEARVEFLKLPPEEAQRLITIRLDGTILNANEDPLSASELTGDASLE